VGTNKGCKKKNKAVWDSDVEDESDAPEYPPGIMKVKLVYPGGYRHDS
jgi:NAD-dependent histone deacetylase SIR2